MWVEEIEHLQTKVRRVRTPEGAEKYGQAVGTIIRAGSVAAAGRRRRTRDGRVIDGEDPGAKPPARAPVRPRPPKAAPAPATAKVPAAKKPTAKKPTATAKVASVKVDKRKTQGQTVSNFVHPDTGHPMGKTESGDTYEQLFQAKMKDSLEEKFGCCLKMITGAGEGTSRTTALDFHVGKRGGEVKSLSSRSISQKTAIKKEERARKEEACAAARLKALLIVQVVDQDSGMVSVYGFPEFASKGVKAMTLLGNYDYTPDDFVEAQKASGHWDKRHTRKAEAKKKAAEKKAESKSVVGEEYDPPDEEGGVFEEGDTVIELREVEGGFAVPFIFTAGQEEEEEEEEEGDVEGDVEGKDARRVRTSAGARRYNQPIGSLIRPDVAPSFPNRPRGLPSPRAAEDIADRRMDRQMDRMAEDADTRRLAEQEELASHLQTSTDLATMSRGVGQLNWTATTVPGDIGMVADHETPDTAWSLGIRQEDDGRWLWHVGGYYAPREPSRVWSHDDREDTLEMAILRAELYANNADRLQKEREQQREREDEEIRQLRVERAERAKVEDANAAQVQALVVSRPPDVPWYPITGRNSYGAGGAQVEFNTDHARQIGLVFPDRRDPTSWRWEASGYSRRMNDNRRWGETTDAAASGTATDAATAAAHAENYMRDMDTQASVPAPPSHTAEEILAVANGPNVDWEASGEHSVTGTFQTEHVHFLANIFPDPDMPGRWRWRLSGSTVGGEDLSDSGLAITPELALQMTDMKMRRADKREEQLKVPIPDDGSFWHFIEEEIPVSPHRYGTDTPLKRQTLHPAAEKRIAETYEGTFGDLTVKVTRVGYSYGTMNIDGAILDADGSAVGEWDASVEDEAYDDDGESTGTPELKIDHGLLKLEDHVQASGLATAWQMQLMQKYVAMGVKKVTTHADITVGGYTWAKAGFGWDPMNGKPHSAMDRLSRAFGLEPRRAWDPILDEYTEVPGVPRLSSPETLEAARAILDRMNNMDVTDPDFPTPQEIARLGLADKYTRPRNANPMGGGASDFDDTPMVSWPGKDILLGSDWYALAKLSYG